jgi:hypothetical protein
VSIEIITNGRIRKIVRNKLQLNLKIICKSITMPLLSMAKAAMRLIITNRKDMKGREIILHPIRHINQHLV